MRLLVPFKGVGGSGGRGGLQAKCLVPCCCNRDSLKFDMQHDHVLKKLICDLLTLRGGGGGGGGGGGA